MYLIIVRKKKTIFTIGSFATLRACDVRKRTVLEYLRNSFNEIKVSPGFLQHLRGVCCNWMQNISTNITEKKQSNIIPTEYIYTTAFT